ncbi:hypothetical protein [Ferrovibrio sp.]|uniref:hypothetical protein n=1 Tax=Ferrovibrio sp. TaxID=1917215 RepID=UPI00261489DB|nr:hypothetical protein [Ferrovibrio sp.]
MLKQIEVDVVPEFVRPSFRTKHACLTYEDWHRIGDDLSAQFPGIGYVRYMTDKEHMAEEKPDIRIERDMRAVRPPAWWFDISFDPGYELGLRYGEREVYSGRFVKGWWRNPMNLPRAYVQCGSAPSPAGVGPGYAARPYPENMGRDFLVFAGEHDNKNHRAIASQFFSIVRRQIFKGPLLLVRYPNYEVVRRYEKNSYEWVSKDSVRWAREDPRRLLVYSGQGYHSTPDCLGYGIKPEPDG